MVQHTEIIKYNIPHKPTQEQKSHGHLNRPRKGFLTSLHEKSPEETRNTRNVPRHNKSCM
jgi:hypothetical protein